MLIHAISYIHQTVLYLIQEHQHTVRNNDTQQHHTSVVAHTATPRRMPHGECW
jgi:hypothetical protein